MSKAASGMLWFTIICLLSAASLATAGAQMLPAKLRVELFILPPFPWSEMVRLRASALSFGGRSPNALKSRQSITLLPIRLLRLMRCVITKADLLLPGIYITVERDREFDFSYMIWEGGQQIMVRDTGEGTTVSPLSDLIGLLFSKTSLAWLGVAATY